MGFRGTLGSVRDLTWVDCMQGQYLNPCLSNLQHASQEKNQSVCYACGDRAQHPLVWACESTARMAMSEAHYDGTGVEKTVSVNGFI